jgi:hypothetical protein
VPERNFALNGRLKTGVKEQTQLGAKHSLVLASECLKTFLEFYNSEVVLRPGLLNKG